MSIHDMQIVMHPDTSTILSRSLSESDLSEICVLGGATGSDPPSPIHMHVAPSDDDDNTGIVVISQFFYRIALQFVCRCTVLGLFGRLLTTIFFR